MNKQINDLLCKIDGRMCFYRMKYGDNKRLKEMQDIIQEIYKINKGV